MRPKRVDKRGRNSMLSGDVEREIAQARPEIADAGESKGKDRARRF